MRNLLWLFCLVGLTGSLYAQTPASMRLDFNRKRNVLEEKSLVRDLPLVNIGPTIMSGRVTDLAVNPLRPEEFYVAYASGGLWKTINNGQSFIPLFDQEDAMTIGAIAVDWKTGRIVIGTGEVNASRSSYAGLGIYLSDDGGQSWQYKGLPESHHIGTVLMHPLNPDEIWVAVLGHLYTDNPERGVYRSRDGGDTWQLVHAVDQRTGAVELTMDSGNPERIYACMWERDRKAWDFTENGPGSGIWVTEDGGESWEKLSDKDSGFPPNAGRTGLAVYPGNTEVIYAVVDNQNPSEEEDQEVTEGLTIADLEGIDKQRFLALDNAQLDSFLRAQNIPAQYTAEVLKEKVRAGEFRATVLNEYLDLGAYVFDAPIRGCEVYRSNDRGRSWKQVNEDDLFSVYNTYGYYFGKIAVAPENPDKVVVLGVPVIMSSDGGKHWETIGGDNVHADHHVIWINPGNSDHMIIGNDGGVNITYDSGKNWFLANTPPVGQFYAVEVDNAKPYNVYGGLQDNGVWYGPSTYNAGNGWHQQGDYPYQFIYGGDGMQVQVDHRDNTTVYTGYQFGYYARLDDHGEDYIAIRPRHEMGEYPLRFNWQTPIHLSRHNQDVLYYGSSRFHRSLMKGEEMETLSADLTLGGKEGNVPYGTITTLDESPLRFGWLVLGTDDGQVHVSTDGGYTWNNRSAGLPKGLWVSRVVASAHKLGRIYLTLNGYRKDDFEAYVYRSEDAGKSWYRMGQELPMEPVNVILEDPVNPSILYLGTDNGLYLSLNSGDNWMAVTGTEEAPFPRVAVHDLVIQEREKDLVVATHGRSLYIMDVAVLQQMTPETLASDLHLFNPEDVKWYAGQGSTPWWRAFGEPDVRKTPLYFYSMKEGVVEFTLSKEGEVLYKTIIDAKKGLNAMEYDLSANDGRKDWDAAENGKYYLPVGQYEVRIESEGHEDSAEFNILE